MAGGFIVATRIMGRLLRWSTPGLLVALAAEDRVPAGGIGVYRQRIMHRSERIGCGAEERPRRLRVDFGLHCDRFPAR